jgi:MFS family permease
VAAPVLLLACRLMQGFAVGGEWGGAVLMAAEHGDDARRGFWSSWPQAGVALGNLLATGVLWVLALVQPDSAFIAWGWRIPFLLSAVLVLVGLWVRLSIEESPVFREAQRELAEKKIRERHQPLLEVVRRYPCKVLIAMGMRMAENISYYLFTVISTLIILAVVVGLILHSLMYAPQAALFSELFGTSVRYTGASAGYQLASIVAGALVPIIALKLLGSTDDPNTVAVAIYMLVASVITIVAVLAAKETVGSSLRHDRITARR